MADDPDEYPADDPDEAQPDADESLNPNLIPPEGEDDGDGGP